MYCTQLVFAALTIILVLSSRTNGHYIPILYEKLSKALSSIVAII